MPSDAFDENDFDERLIAVLADAQGCRASMYWRKTFGHIGNGQNDLYVYGEYETINDATLMFSLLALRKIDEFLSDETRNAPLIFDTATSGLVKPRFLRVAEE